MNAMTQALQAAGVKTPPQIQRVWMVLKDTYRTPGMTAVDVAKATGLSIPAVSSLLTDLYRRDMVTAVKMPCAQARGPQYKMYYAALGSTYELKPRRHTKPPATKAAALEEQRTREFRASPVHLVQKPAAPATAHGVDLDKLTLGQIKALLADIQAIFNK